MSNRLRQHPFFQVPNVNPDDPISVQIEQIEQLNTLLLQDIDHNFARFHDVVTSKILPSVKRFGLASEPTREAAHFWKSFFEAAASVRVPVPGEYSETAGDASTTHQQETYTDHEESLDRTAMTPEEHSFLYGNPVTSTPLPRHHEMQGENDWAEGMSSMDSPLASLERKMKHVLENDDGMSSTAGGSMIDPDASDRGDETIREERGNRGYEMPEGYDEEPSVLISRKGDLSSSYNLGGTGGTASNGLPDLPKSEVHALKRENAERNNLPSSPRARQNPFSPAGPSGSSSKAWNGIADLRNTPLNPKIRPIDFGPTSTAKKPIRQPQFKVSSQAKSRLTDFDLDFDDSLDSIPDNHVLGTPPVTMNFSLPARAISKTPAKDAARAVIRDLMAMEGMDSPVMPSPPAFERMSGRRGMQMEESRQEEQLEMGGDVFGLGGERSGLEGGMEELSVEAGSSFVRDVQAEEGSFVQEQEDMEDEREETQRQDPDTSTVGMPRRSTVHQLDFLEESFDDSLDEMPPVLSQTYAHDGGNDTLGPADVPEGGDFTETMTGGHRDEADTRQSTRSEAGRIFGGPKGPGKGQFALFGPDEMQTFHGGKLLDGVASPQASPSYALGEKMAGKRG